MRHSIAPTLLASSLHYQSRMVDPHRFLRHLLQDGRSGHQQRWRLCEASEGTAAEERKRGEQRSTWHSSDGGDVTFSHQSVPSSATHERTAAVE